MNSSILFVSALRKYKGRLSFLPIKEYIPKTSNNNTTKPVPVTKNRRVSIDGLGEEDHSEHARLRTKSVPSKLYRGKSWSQTNIEEETDEKLEDVENSGAGGDYVQNGNVGMSDEVSPASGEIRFSLDTENCDEGCRRNDADTVSIDSVQELIKISKSTDGKVPSFLPPLSEPVPADWTTLDEEFVSVAACYQTHLGSDIIFAPDARFNDGVIHLCFIKAGIQKTELIELMGLLEKGTHMDHPSPNIEYIKCLAFRLQPEGEDGIIMVDGEKVDYGPLQAQILPGAATIMGIQ